jgi:glycosyltransferase involved in cell wall biosynthesis
MVILDMHDIEREAVGYFGKISTSRLRKIWFMLEQQKVILLERRAISYVTGMVTVSHRDRERYIKYYPYSKRKWFYVNNGIDLKKSQDEPMVQRNENTVIFVGSLRHPPNIHGIRWFVQCVWPEITQHSPNAKLIIVGSGEAPAEEHEIYESAPHVEFKGYVENIYPLLRSSTCMVVPLFGGSGTRLKILEAFSFKLPVVSTSIGAEGLPVSDGKHILIANSVEQMASAILQLFEEKSLSDRLTQEAYSLVSNEYDWDVIGDKLKEELRARNE